MIYLIHGFNVANRGLETTDRLKEYIPGAVDLDYGWTGRVGVRVCNDKLAQIIAKMAEPNSIAIGHSNGCDIIHRATHHGAKFEKVIYLNPALDNDLTPGDYVKWCHVWHSPSDGAVWLAKWIPFSSWGDMGKVGYQGSDPRMINHNIEEYIEDAGHSDLFTSPDILTEVAIQAVS